MDERFDLSQEGWRLEQVGELGFISSSSIFLEFALLVFYVNDFFLLGFNFRIVVNDLYEAYQGIILDIES